jgi:hypothetical protein
MPKQVQLNIDWKTYKAGDILTVEHRPRYVLDFLINQGWAVDISNDDPIQVEEKPTMDSSKKEIEAYLDKHNITFSEYAKKSELLELIP